MDGQNNKCTPEQIDHLTSGDMSDSIAKDDSKECKRYWVAVEHVVKKSPNADNSNSEVDMLKKYPTKSQLDLSLSWGFAHQGFITDL